MASDLDHLDRQDAIALAKKFRNKVRNMSVDKNKLMTGAARTAVSAAAGYGMGYVMGGLEAEYEANQSAVDAGTAEDPRKIAGVDKDLALGLLLSGIGLLSAAGTAPALAKISKGADLVAAAGDGILAGWSFMQGAKAGKEAAQQG